MHKFCVAPMMDRTDRHERYFLRTITTETLLYSEMIHANAVVYGDTTSLLKHHQNEHPLAIQLGGSDPSLLAEAAQVAQNYGFKEINLNVGCPSDRVQKGRFGAILMKEPNLVADCVKAMIENTNLSITVKCRIGVDDMNEDAGLDDFINQVKDAGCNTFIVHARKAWLKGLSPKENREIPPINYSRVYKLKEDFSDLNIVINGEISSIEQSLSHLEYVDGVMMGREAYDNPYLLKDVDTEIFKKKTKIKSRKEILMSYLPYLETEHNQGVKLVYATKHLMGLFKGLKGAKEIRRFLTKIDSIENPIEQYKQLAIGFNE
ncbi:MAG: tRNA dihydrouridine(20/20a) synthase DusA [SAR86 cluster bacterium]|nr:tRNA dihydrouridine(20/20a) synthase DusA [SAR86 cluster bacterium]